MKISLRLILLFAVALTSCQKTTAPPTVSEQRYTTQTQPTEADNWQRTKDCAARVDAMKDDKPASNMQHGRISHYSRKYGRCFVKVADTRSLRGNANERQNSVMLMDVFEGSIGAMLPFVGPCYLGGKQEDCGKAEAFDVAMAN
jgi:hypothetical protein